MSPSGERPHRGWIDAAVLVASLFLSLGLCEVALRTVFPLPRSYFVAVPGLHYVFHPRDDVTPGVSGDAHFEVCSLGVRAPREPLAGETVVLAVDGSTTEESILDLEETWMRSAQARLTARPGSPPVRIGDAGRSGHGTREHLLQVRELLALLPRTRAVVLLVGGNDLLRRLAEDADYDPGAVSRQDFEERNTQRAFATYPPALRLDAPIWKRTELWTRMVRGIATLRLALAARASGVVQDDAVENITAWRAQRRHAVRLRDNLPDIASGLDEYRSNLAEIIRRVRATGAQPLLLTQPTVWRGDLPPHVEELLWLAGVGDFRNPEVRAEYYTPAALAEGMNRYNAALLEVCAQQAAPCLDLATVIPKDSRAFYDDLHFTEAGARMVAERVAAALSPLLSSKLVRTDSEVDAP